MSIAIAPHRERKHRFGKRLRAASSRQAVVAFVDPYDYAEDLYFRAAGRLDAAVLHSWMIQRLVVDLGLEHALAAQVSDALLDRKLCHPR